MTSCCPFLVQPENVLIDDADAPKMKISSFALAQFVSPGNVLVKVCGNWAYAAPEMSDPSCPGYNCRFDVFSFGVILCAFLRRGVWRVLRDRAPLCTPDRLPPPPLQTLR